MVEADHRSDEEIATELVQDVLQTLAEQKSRTTDVDQISIHDGYMMCISNFYTLTEMIMHMTTKVGVLKSDVVRCFGGLTRDKKYGMAYVKHSCQRSKMRAEIAAEQALALRMTQEATSSIKYTRKRK